MPPASGGLFSSRPGRGGIEAVYVFKKIGVNMIPERVKDKIDTLPSGQFGRRNKVLITRYQDNLVHLFFQG